MRIAAIESTDRFIASGQVLRVTLAAESATGPIRLSVSGPAVNTPEPALVPALAAGETYVAEVGVRPDAPWVTGSRRPVTAVAETAGARSTADGELIVADTGWTMWMVSHFHYDPVWWNTQGGFTQAWYDLPAAEERRPPAVATAFDLVRAHLDAARHDPDYKFVLAEVDYLKPYWDACPEDRADLRRFLAEGRVEIVGGNYNEPNTNLTHPESTIRNAAYGVAYQRDVVGGDPRTAWMLDVFGHDPAYPGLMADAGLTSSAWARGPFHMWGPQRHVGDNRRMQFPAEFEWISPNGRGLLTAYMANHYGAGWEVERARTPEEAAEIAYGQFAELSPVAATRNVLLPVGADHVVPSRWCTEIGRDWNKRYVWPRFVVGLPRDFFAAVRAELGERRRKPSPQTRDMNPVYTGKDVSYTDTKQAQRAAEVAVLDAERLATLAALKGARYPAEALDKAWRQLVFGAHHDAITGSESDQVYADLLGGWREAYELGDTVRTAALDHLAAGTGTSLAGEGRPLVVANTLSWPRDGITTVRLAGETPGVGLVDDRGEPVPFVAEAAGDGEITLAFLARDVPALGLRVYRVLDSAGPPPRWTPVPGAVSAANTAFAVTADPARGGALTSIRDLRAGRELLRPGGLGGELICQEEYDTHPAWGEGPWHLLPKGPGRGTGERPATVRVERCPIGSRLVTETALDELTITVEVLLWDGVDRVDFRTRVDGSIGHDRLLRVRFDLDVPGARPVSEVGFAAIGRPFGFPDADTAEHLWTLDNPAHTWTALSTTAKILLLADDGTDSPSPRASGTGSPRASGTGSPRASGTGSPRASGTGSPRASGTGSLRASGTTQAHAIGVAEVIAAEESRDVLAALVAQGVTATGTRPEGPRYGSLDVDSNLPDVRIALGGPGENAFTAEVLAAADPAYGAALAANGRVFVPAARPMSKVWTPGADLRGVRDLPVLIVADDPADLCADLADSAIEVTQPDGLPGADEAACDHSVAILNAGTPGTVAKLGEALYLNLMRACSTWPSGVWIDGPLRTAPDGSSLSWQHWTHTFRYALAAGEGDWRSAGFVRAGQEFNHAVLARPASARPGEPSAALVTVEPQNVLLTALKLAGDEVTVRVHESAGRPVTARIGLFTGVAGARRTDVLESAGGEKVNADAVPLGPADVATLRLRPSRRAATAGPPLGPGAEPAQPVFTRYWLHNKGPAPLGNLPTAVHLSPRRLTSGGRLRLTVAASSRPAAGRVELLTPPGLTITEPGAYDLGRDEYVAYDLDVDASGAAPGTYFVAARIRDDLGQALEDVVAVEVGPAPSGDPLDVVVEPAPPPLRPGEQGEIAVRLGNRAASPVRGEAQLISPYGTWGQDLLITPWTRGFEVAPGETVRVPFVVRADAAARPGSWWALVKVAYFGFLYYTGTIGIDVTG